MKKKTPKELLTKENCKRDLLKLPMPFAAWFLMAVALLFSAAAFVLFILYAPLLEGIIGTTLFGLFFVMLAVAFPYEEYVRRKKNRKIREGRFHVEEAVLERIVMNAYHHRPARHDSGRRTRLDFADHRNFFLDVETDKRFRNFTYYKWSDSYMTSAGILNTTQVGDTFYLLVYDDDPERKPIMVYNAKYFEYDEYRFCGES